MKTSARGCRHHSRYRRRFKGFDATIPGKVSAGPRGDLAIAVRFAFHCRVTPARISTLIGYSSVASRTAAAHVEVDRESSGVKHNNAINISGTRNISFVRRFFFAAVLACAAQGAAAQDAKAILKSMSDYVGSQKTIELTFDSDIEIITPQLEKLQFTNSGDALLSRPDKLRAHRVGGYTDVELYFNGQTVSIFGKSANAYAQFEVPGTVDQLIDALRSGHGIALPGADLLLSNSYEALVADVKEAKYMGRGVVDGIECEHLAFRNPDTDWQLWVEVGDRPIPRKMVITSKTMNSAPQYTLRVKTWKTGGKPSSKAFAFVPKEGLKKLNADELIDLDELPQGADAGGNK